MQKPSALQARLVTAGLAFGESPRWHDGRLWLATGAPARSSPSTSTATAKSCSPCQLSCPTPSTGCRMGAYSLFQAGKACCCAKSRTAHSTPTPICAAYRKARGTRSSSTGAATSMSMAAGRRRLPASISVPAPSCWSRPDGRGPDMVAEDIAFANGLDAGPEDKTLIMPIPCKPADRLRHRCRRHPVQPMHLGRSRWIPRRHLPRCRGGYLVRGCSQQALCTGA